MSPSPGDHSGRTIPEWMDLKNLNGRLYYMVLKAADGHVLPKNPFLVGRSVEQIGKVEGAFYEKSQNWYVLKLRNKEKSRELTKLTKLIDGTPIKIEYHPRLNQRKFVVTCPEVEGMSNQELQAELSSQQIIDVRRITKKTSNDIVITNTLILTICSTIVPEFINFGLLRVRTRLYYPLPLLCRTCLKYGHPKSKCTATLACNRCHSSDHDSQACTKNPYCGNCKQEGHTLSSRICPIWVAETAALKLSTEKNITIAEARKMAQQISNINTYANILKSDQPKTMRSVKSTPARSIQSQQQQQQQQQLPNQKRSPPANQPNTVSPPRKRLTSDPSPEDKATDIDNTSGNLCSQSREMISSNTPAPSQLPSPPSNPFQPTPSFNNKFDPRHRKTCNK
ncbi:uncharacterized protein LOC129760161 [Uranotaenia lowii]|uniref:uncharacterized protein LOC129760161 n=1 Tax=Uranotaenia lowii TaxID=190385 RepID=UPI00247AFDA8|nr:uncharacterized protein LOC129760161 [Uranotaenia lowii]